MHGLTHVQETFGRNGSSPCVSIAQYPSGMLQTREQIVIPSFKGRNDYLPDPVQACIGNIRKVLFSLSSHQRCFLPNV